MKAAEHKNIIANIRNIELDKVSRKKHIEATRPHIVKHTKCARSVSQCSRIQQSCHKMMVLTIELKFFFGRVAP